MDWNVGGAQARGSATEVSIDRFISIRLWPGSTPTRSAETRRLVLNSLLWAAKVTGVEEQPADQE